MFMKLYQFKAIRNVYVCNGDSYPLKLLYTKLFYILNANCYSLTSKHYSWTNMSLQYCSCKERQIIR